MNRRKASEIALLVLAIAVLSPSNAWAYIDPGTGSYLFQLVIAGGLAGIYTLRRNWRSFRSWVTRGKSQD